MSGYRSLGWVCMTIWMAGHGWMMDKTGVCVCGWRGVSWLGWVMYGYVDGWVWEEDG